MRTFVTVAAIAGAASMADAACPGAYMGLKGGQFDVDGYDASGYDVFGFSRNGVDRWNRPCSDPNAGLTPAGGRFISEPAVPTTSAGEGPVETSSGNSGEDDAAPAASDGAEGPNVFYEVYPAHINYVTVTSTLAPPAPSTPAGHVVPVYTATPAAPVYGAAAAPAPAAPVYGAPAPAAPVYAAPAPAAPVYAAPAPVYGPPAPAAYGAPASGYGSTAYGYGGSSGDSYGWDSYGDSDSSYGAGAGYDSYGGSSGDSYPSYGGSSGDSYPSYGGSSGDSYPSYGGSSGDSYPSYGGSSGDSYPSYGGSSGDSYPSYGTGSTAGYYRRRRQYAASPAPVTAPAYAAPAPAPAQPYAAVPAAAAPVAAPAHGTSAPAAPAEAASAYPSSDITNIKGPQLGEKMECQDGKIVFRVHEAMDHALVKEFLESALPHVSTTVGVHTATYVWQYDDVNHCTIIESTC